VRFWSIGVLAGVLAAGAQPQSAPPAEFKVPVRLVTAPTLVFSGDDRLVFGLHPEDFEVYDNGHPQKAAVDPDPWPPFSIVLAVEANQDVRGYARFISRVGSAVEALLVGERGEAAVIEYSDEVKVLKPFGEGDVAGALRRLSGTGRGARAIDAGMRAAALLESRPAASSRVLIFVGQPADRGSESPLAALRREVERNSIAVYALALPLAGREFLSDPFSLEGLSSKSDRGGFRAGADLRRLASVLHGGAAATEGADPFSTLTAATGGTQFHFRAQRELEDGIGLIGLEMRSSYLVSYSPAPGGPGYHAIRIEVGVPGAKVFSRPGYWWGGDRR
jgi:VWFA-related protein